MIGPVRRSFLMAPLRRGHRRSRTVSSAVVVVVASVVALASAFARVTP